MTLPARLDCTRCRTFRDFERGSGNVVYCGECGKKHSHNNVYVIDPDRTYERDRHGELQELPP